MKFDKKKSFLKQPIYDGGHEALDKFIRDHLQYPKEALEAKIEGSVEVSYDINHKGEVFKTTIKRSLGHGCDEEAERLVKMLRFRVPKNRKVRVTFHKNILIHFRLPAQPAKPSIQYHYVSEKKKAGGYTLEVKNEK